MIRFRASLAAALLLALPAFASPDPDAAETYRLMRSTVQIKVRLKWPSEPDGLLRYFSSNAQSDDKPKGWRGSGTVIEVDRAEKQSLVLTAGHVCDYPAGALPTMTVIGLDGSRSQARPLAHSVDMNDPRSTPDVCVVEVDGIPGPAVHLAKRLPPLGAELKDIGAPLGFKQNGGFFATKGIYFGQMEGFSNRFLLVSTPVIGGLSGSALFYRGRIVGVVVYAVAAGAFEHLTGATNLDDVTAMVQRARVLWHPSKVAAR